ncbi:MAG: ferritin family protein [Clostridiales bacterium]|nr:ferritin family protein [Clostridiales bacterium]
MKSLEYALQIEMDGIDFYLEKADANKENSLHKLFVLIAKDELRHAAIIRKMMKGELESLPDNEALASIDSIFKNADAVLDNVYSASEQLAVYRMAREIEKRGIDLYHQLASESTNETEKKVFRYLLGQERQHYDLFDELATRVGRPEEWVESAEFGPREEY